jgi:hypothetical protein
MPVTMLNPGDQHPMRAAALEVGWRVQGCARDQVLVTFEDGGGHPAAQVQPVGPQSLLLTGWPQAVALVARPVGTGAFPDGVRLDAYLNSKSHQTTGDQVVLPSFDISSTSSALLLTVAPAGDGCVVAVPAATSTPAADLGSDSLVQRAAYSARRQSGSHTMPDHLRRTVSLAIDQSASMLPHHRSGAVQSLLELVLGVNLMCGTAETVPVWSLESPPRRLPRALERTTITGYAAEELGRGPFTSGSALAPLIEHIDHSGTGDACVVVTDGVPADLNAVTTALTARTRPVSWHLLAVARGPADPAARSEPWLDELRALDPAIRAGLLAVASISPGDQPDWLAGALSSAGELDALVGALALTKGT